MNVGLSIAVQTNQQEKINQSKAIFVTSYVDPLKSKEIEVWLNDQKEFEAVIRILDKLGNVLNTTKNLPLSNLPKQIASYGDVATIRYYFEQAYLVPEKDLKGLYNRVSVHMIGPGAGRSTIPFQPGLALGSVIRGSSLEKMEAYSETMANQQAFEEQISNAEKQMELLTAKIKTKENSKRKGDQALIGVWQQQLTNIEKALTSLIEKIAKDPGDIPIFEGFHQALESPIDLGTSKIEIQPRGFDSLEYSSQYIKLDEDIAKIHEKITQSSSANSISAGGGGGFGLFSAKVSASHSWTNALANRVSEIRNNSKSEGILLIHATVTTRNVRCFTDLKYNKAKLQMLQHVMKHEEKTEVLNRYGITTDGDEKAIYMLTEAVLGGAFTALVTFLNAKDETRDVKNEKKESSSNTSVSAKAGWGIWKAGGGFSRASSNDSQTEDDVLESVRNTRVNIEMFAHGAIPVFARNLVENEIMKHANLDPSKFELTAKEEADTEALNKAIKSKDQEKIDNLVAKQEAKQVKNQEAFLNGIRALKSEKQVQKIHTVESIFSAYENFAKKITEDDESGIPVGFNYQILTEDDVDRLLEEIKITEGGPAKSTVSNSKESAKGGSVVKDDIRENNTNESVSDLL